MKKMLLLLPFVLFFHDNTVINSGRLHLYTFGPEFHMTRVLRVSVPPELEMAFSDAVFYWHKSTGVDLFTSVEEDADVAIRIVDIGHYYGLAHMDGKLDLRNRVYNITGGWIKINPRVVGDVQCEWLVLIHELGHMLGMGDDENTGMVMDIRSMFCEVSEYPLDSDRELVLEDIRNAGIR
jgi:hypothetical protein